MLIKHSLKLAMLALWVASLAACMPQPQRISINAHDITWDVQEIHVQANKPIELTLSNHGALDHAFQIQALGIDVLLSPGDVEIVTFSVNEPATIQYICSIPGHEEAGMVGYLVVGP